MQIGSLLDELLPFQAQALLLGFIIYPLQPDEQQRFIDAECYLTLREVVREARNPQAKDEILMPLHLLTLDLRRAQQCRKRGWRILSQERLITAQMAQPLIADYVLKKLGGGLHGLREEGEPIGPNTLDTLCEWALRQQRRMRGKPDKASGISNQVRQRAWKSSKPVLHLAVALDTMTDGPSPEARSSRLGAVFDDSAQVKELLKRAERARRLLLETAAHGKFELRETDTIQVTCEG